MVMEGGITPRLLIQFKEIWERGEEARQHFTEWFDFELFEHLGWVSVERPVHQPSGIPHDPSHCLRLTPLGKEIADIAYNAWGELYSDSVEIARTLTEKYRFSEEVNDAAKTAT